MTVTTGNRLKASILAIALALAGCGGDDDDSGNGGGSSGGAGDGCLSAAQVQKKVDDIASGFEGSDAEVKRKQQQIRDVRAKECP